MDITLEPPGLDRSLPNYANIIKLVNLTSYSYYLALRVLCRYALNSISCTLTVNYYLNAFPVSTWAWPLSFIILIAMLRMPKNLKSKWWYSQVPQACLDVHRWVDLTSTLAMDVAMGVKLVGERPALKTLKAKLSRLTFIVYPWTVDRLRLPACSRLSIRWAIEVHQFL